MDFKSHDLQFMSLREERNQKWQKKFWMTTLQNDKFHTGNKNQSLFYFFLFMNYYDHKFYITKSEKKLKY